MPLDLHDLRSAFDDASAGPHDNPHLLGDLDRRIRRGTRRRYAAGAVALTAVAALVAIPLVGGGGGGQALLKPSPTRTAGLPEGDSRRTPQDPGPKLDLKRGAEPVVPATPPIDGEIDFRLPHEDVFPDGAQGERVEWAVRQLADRCLDRFGLDMPSAAGPIVEIRPGIEIVRGFGLADPARAAAHGYAYPKDPRDDGKSMDPPALQKYPQMTKTAYLVFLGDVAVHEGEPVPAEGCLGEARRALGWKWANYGMNVQELYNRAAEYTLKDSRVRAATRNWSTCMKGAGFVYSEPLQPLRVYSPAKVQPGELATAQADIACKRQTNLVGVGMAVRTAYELQLMERNAAKLAPLKKDLRELVERTEALIAKEKPATG